MWLARFTIELFTRMVGSMLPRAGNFSISGLQKWRFLDSEHKSPIISAPNIDNISKRGL